MRIYSCKADWEAMLTCIYEAWLSKLGHENIKLVIEPIEQYSLFNEYVHVDADPVKADKVINSIITRISPELYREMAVTAMAYEEDALDNIYHILILGFAYGPNILKMMQFKDVMRNYEIRKRVEKEANRFQEFIRFHQLGGVYIAHIEPKSRIAEYLGPIFQDRMPSENFIIVDDVHMVAVIHHANTQFYLRNLTQDELEGILESESINDEFTDLWKVFFDTIAIEERKNIKCQNNHFPKWTRKHAVEFIR